MIEIGKMMYWRKVVSNWGHEMIYTVRVKRVGKRVTVDVLSKDGYSLIHENRVVRNPDRLFDTLEQAKAA